MYGLVTIVTYSLAIYIASYSSYKNALDSIHHYGNACYRLNIYVYYVYYTHA